MPITFIFSYPSSALSGITASLVTRPRWFCPGTLGALRNLLCLSFQPHYQFTRPASNSRSNVYSLSVSWPATLDRKRHLYVFPLVPRRGSLSVHTILRGRGGPDLAPFSMSWLTSANLGRMWYLLDG